MDEFVTEIDLIGSVATRTGYVLEHDQLMLVHSYMSNVIVKVILRGVCLI
jgi:hypothetical protein